MVRARTRNRIALFVVTLLAAAGAATPTVAAAAAAKLPLNILVMGDSYSAGNGAGNYQGQSGCYRSPGDYAALFSSALVAAGQPTTFKNVACSGATTAAFAGNQITAEPLSTQHYKLAPQLSAISAGTDLIFLTVGGNDIHFADIVKQCLISSTNNGAACAALLTGAETAIATGKLKNSITAVLTQIYAKSDKHVKVVLLGYPYLIGDNAYTLGYRSGGKTVTVQVGKRLKAISDKGEAVQSGIVAGLDAAAAYSAYHPFTFVSVKKLFAGPPWHGLYAAKTNANRWMVDPKTDRTASLATLFHPNPTGWRQEAAMLGRTGAIPKTKTQPAIGPGDLPAGTVGAPYSATLAGADGRPGSWAVTSGKLPTGLRLAGSFLVGTPSVAGAVTLGLSFTDSLGTVATGSKTLLINARTTTPAGWKVQKTPTGEMPFHPQCGGALCADISPSVDSAGRVTYTLMSQTGGGAWHLDPTTLPATVDAGTGYVGTMGCVQVGGCVAIGNYQQQTCCNYEAVLWSNTGSGWTMSRPALPANATNYINAAGLSCGVDSCATLQWYTPAGSNGWQPLLWTWTPGGGWKFTTAPLPTGSAAEDPVTNSWDSGSVASSCGTSVCVVVDDYQDVNGVLREAVWTWSGGAWSLHLTPIPAGWQLKEGFAELGCGAGVCGYFDELTTSTAPISSSAVAYTWTSAGGWDNGGPGSSGAVIKNVACAAFCLAPGSYTDAAGGFHNAVWAWTRDAGWHGVTPDPGDVTGYDSVSCGSTICGLAGEHTDPTPTARFWTTDDGTTLTPATDPADPNRAQLGMGGSISCGGAICAAAVSSVSGAFTGTGELLFFDGHGWSELAPLPIPGDGLNGTVGNSGYMSCGTAVCAAGGSYVTSQQQLDDGRVSGLLWSYYHG